VLDIARGWTPTTSGLAAQQSSVGTMPHMAVVAGENHHSICISCPLQERCQRAYPVDRPVVPYLLGAAEAIIDSVDDHADDAVLGFKDGVVRVLAQHPSGTFRDFRLVEKDRRVPLVAHFPQCRVRLEVPLLDG